MFISKHYYYANYWFNSGAVFVSLLLINLFCHAFRSSENEFLEILTILKSNPKTAQKLHKAMIKELYDSMNNGLKDIMKEGSLQETLSKIAKLSEENTIPTNKHAWSVIRFVKKSSRDCSM